jgi:AbrB family looped-hinge helix DNA binding protein
MTEFSRAMPLNDNGRVVIPKEVREAIGIQPGDDVIFQVNGDTVHLTTRAALARRLRGALRADDARDHTGELLEDRRGEAERKW